MINSRFIIRESCHLGQYFIKNIQTTNGTSVLYSDRIFRPGCSIIYSIMYFNNIPNAKRYIRNVLKNKQLILLRAR